MLGSLVLITQDSLAVRLPEQQPGLPMKVPDKLFLIRNRVGCRGGKKEQATEIKNRLRTGITREVKKLFGLAQGDLFNQKLKPGPCTGQ